ncbi:MAG: glycosyltransferase family 2 protein [Candidatus Bathyarchaeota archaeon]|nr:glycosyltransferase family 2 protein [Candidatus Bathyarchaeota archaeon]
MIELLRLFFLLLVAVIAAYIVRHYVFTLTVLYGKKKEHYEPNYETQYQPKVSVLIPAHNEELVIERILQRMTELTYPKQKMEIILIDDASTDRTGEKAEKFAKPRKFIKVLHRSAECGGKGKPEVLNYALEYATGEIIYCFDADYYPQRDIIEKLTEYFQDPKVGAVQGRVTVLNEPNTLVTRLVALERTGGYRVDQSARDELELISQFGGTVGGFRKSLLDTFGGWDPDMLTEDTDLTFKVYLAGYKVKYVNHADCYEEAVEDWWSYWRQRSRWAKGHMQCAFKHLLPILRSNKLRLRQKVDGCLLLNIYFVPIFAGLAWLIGALLFLFQPVGWTEILWASMPVAFYSSVGNFAPFFEVGIGAYLDGRNRTYWLIPLMCITFVINMLICSKAFVELCFSKITGKKRHSWSKTVHNGNGNKFIL